MKINFTLSLLLFGFALFSQPAIELLPSDTSLIDLNADISHVWEEFRLGIDIKNTTSDTLMMVWRKEMPDDCPTEWETIIADPNITYLPHVLSNYDTALNIFLPVTMYPNQLTQFGYYVELYPNTVPGCCTIPVYFSLLEAPDSIISTAYFSFAINDPSCDFVNDIEEIENEISIFPNPVNNILFIESEVPIQEVQLFNLYGQLLRSEFNAYQININSLPKGVFIIKIVFSDGKIAFQKIEKI